MKRQSIKKYLRPYSIEPSRRTTINHAFASAIAEVDAYDDDQVRARLVLLGQDPDGDLLCVYCDAPANDWDHVYAIVQGGQYSGNGHTLRNLVPSCKRCNSELKGNKDWRLFLRDHPGPEEADLRARREARIAAHVEGFTSPARGSAELEEAMLEFAAIKDQVLSLMKDADQIAARIRELR